MKRILSGVLAVAVAVACAGFVSAQEAPAPANGAPAPKAEVKKPAKKAKKVKKGQKSTTAAPTTLPAGHPPVGQ